MHCHIFQHFFKNVTRECEKVKKLPDCFEISVTATNIAGTSVRANISNSDHHQCGTHVKAISVQYNDDSERVNVKISFAEWSHATHATQCRVSNGTHTVTIPRRGDTASSCLEMTNTDSSIWTADALDSAGNVVGTPPGVTLNKTSATCSDHAVALAPSLLVLVTSGGVLLFLWH
jgi:hypothetical protein